MRTFITSLTLTLTLVLTAQVDDMVSLNAGYSNQSFYSLENGEVANVSNTDWDIAFMSTALNSSILINDNIGTMLYSYGTDPSAWETVDTTGMAWEPLYNSETSWERGAFMQLANEDNVFDYGWGEYNIITHVVTGNRIFIIALSDGSYRKILIEELDLGTYTFKYADLQGNVEVQETISGTDYSTKNFWYYSLQTGDVIDREPAADSWDITFTRYSSEILPGANYIVSGVFQNQEVLASEARTVEIDDAQWTDQPMSEEMNIIGSDWKYFDMDIFQYVVEDSLSYFVQDREGNVWHLWFTA
ncbi:MAG: hypothetical protein HKN79_00600, partial [Flavobacteriales bacterium]|nr:hypothetical protein [Flavobacteriales bacterium]